MGIAVAGLIVAAGWAIAAGSTAGREELVSVPEDPYLFGVQGSRSSTACDLSGSGRHVVFESAAQQLVERDHNGRTDVFVRDRTDGTVERINRYVDGTENPSGATAASISTNGRYVALLSLDALHDPALPTQAARQAYRIDRDTGEILLASRTTSGAPSPSDVYSPTISGNGRYVAFASSGTQFGAPTNGLQQVFRWDAQTDTIELVSADAAGSAGVSTSNSPSMSNNGRYVAFTSVAGNLVPGDTNGLTDVFVKDMVTGDILRASVDSAGNPATASSSSAPAIAGNGSAVAFQSADPGLVAGDGNGVTDVFVHVLANGETLRASVDGARRERSFVSQQPAQNPQAPARLTAVRDARVQHSPCFEQGVTVAVHHLHERLHDSLVGQMRLAASRQQRPERRQDALSGLAEGSRLFPLEVPQQAHAQLRFDRVVAACLSIDPLL